MSRHTTMFTADPEFRARQEIRDRLKRLQSEARTTGGAMATMGDTREQQMWTAVVRIAGEFIGGLEAQNEAERLDKIAAADRSAYDRRPRTPQVGTELS